MLEDDAIDVFSEVLEELEDGQGAWLARIFLILVKYTN